MCGVKVNQGNNMLSYDAISKKFLEYFKSQRHTVVPSASLIPADDPSLLFVNAGMVPFKRMFLGTEKPGSNRLTSAQRCLRVGGKHNDLDQVGYTARHHTLFTMLGNFSFGDYFKKEAISFAWQFITEELSIDKSKLYVTVHDSDDEAYEIWRKLIGLSPDRVIRCGDADNFWMMGDVGPCGPCSEIFYDHGPSCKGGLPGSDDQDGDRYMEIWNLVFMQYERKVDGVMMDLPEPSVDTGMGLERISAVMQGVHDTYDIDIYVNMMKVLNAHTNISLPRHAQKIIVDHMRASFFMILDHVVPSNEGRGYVLRRILRRALRYAYQSGMTLPGLYKLIPEFCDILSKSDHRLIKDQSFIVSHIKREESQFMRTLKQGMQVIEQQVLKKSRKVIDAQLMFKLYDTYGFPIDITRDVAKENNLSYDEYGYEKLMKVQRQKSKKSAKFQSVGSKWSHLSSRTEFIGYDETQSYSDVEALLTVQGDSAESLSCLTAGQRGMVILNKTPCYAESGGQVGDSGEIKSAKGLFVIEDTQRDEGVISHIGYVKSGQIVVGDGVHVTVSQERSKTILNHSATHLVHYALRKVLGNHVVQKGSLVEPARLRFDFTHHKPLTRDQIDEVELLVNEMVCENRPSQVSWMSLKDALNSDAMSLFGEKYSDPVRVVRLADVSVELCGGLHVNAAGDIGCFKIKSEGGVASGVRRIEAITGPSVVRWWQERDSKIRSIEKQVKQSLDQIPKKFDQINAELKEIKSQSHQRQDYDTWMRSISEKSGHVVGFKDAIDKSVMMTLADKFVNIDNRVLVLITGSPGAYQYIIACQKGAKISAKEALSLLESELNISGGGRPERVQGVIKDDMQIQALCELIKERLDQ